MKKPDYLFTGTTLDDGTEVRFQEPVTNPYRALALRAKAQRGALLADIQRERGGV